MKKFRYLTVLLLFGCTIGYGQNQLERSKTELNSGRSSSSSSSKRSSSSSEDKTSPSEVLAMIKLLGYVVYGVGKYGIVGDYSSENHLNNSLTAYPFYNGQSGNYEKTDTLNIKRSNFRIDVEDHFIYSNASFYGNHMAAKFRPTQYIYFQSDYFQFFESNKFKNTTDQLSLFYFNLGYDRLRLEKFNLGFTLGASYVGNEVNMAGLSVGLNAEYFLKKNISFSGEAKWSAINGYPVNSYKIQSKVFRKNFYFGMVLEHLKIATPSYNLVGIGGGVYL